MSTPNDLKQMAIQDILTQYPKTEPVFQKFGLMSYARTRTAQFENLEASALVNAVDIQALLQALTETLNG